jgi:hypothetical protein
VKAREVEAVHIVLTRRVLDEAWRMVNDIAELLRVYTSMSSIGAAWIFGQFVVWDKIRLKLKIIIKVDNSFSVAVLVHLQQIRQQVKYGTCLIIN